MNIYILTPSIYMYEKIHHGRIFAPGDLVRKLVHGLVEKNHTVTWFTAPGEDTKSILESGDRELLEDNLSIRVFQDLSPEIKDRMSLYATKMYYELDLVERAYQEAQENHADIIHIFSSFGYFAHFFAELTDIPTVFTFHDTLPTDDMLERWLFDRFFSPRYISISKAQQGRYASKFIGNVYNGVDTKRFAYNEIQKNGDMYIGLGRMIPEKGFDQAIQAAQKVRIPLSMATWLTENVVQSSFYKEKIAPFVDGDRIVLSSLKEGEELVRMYQQGKALLFPIRWDEPFGMVMIEAMACGTPVIAYARGSVPEVVVDGVTGFIINESEEQKRGDWIIKKTGVEGLVEAIQRLQSMPKEEYITMRRACRTHVEEHFSVEQMVSGYERVYRDVVEKTERYGTSS